MYSCVITVHGYVMCNCIMQVCVYVSYSEALQVATFIRKNAKRQTTRFAGCLEIGPTLKIPIKIFTKVLHAVHTRESMSTNLVLSWYCMHTPNFKLT